MTAQQRPRQRGTAFDVCIRECEGNVIGRYVGSRYGRVKDAPDNSLGSRYCGVLSGEQ